DRSICADDEVATFAVDDRTPFGLQPVALNGCEDEVMPIFSPRDVNGELLPIDMILQDGPLVHSVAAARKDGARRKLVTTLNGKELEFFIDKDEMTIGRSKANDIRIPSRF